MSQWTRKAYAWVYITMCLVAFAFACAYASFLAAQLLALLFVVSQRVAVIVLLVGAVLCLAVGWIAMAVAMRLLVRRANRRSALQDYIIAVPNDAESASHLTDLVTARLVGLRETLLRRLSYGLGAFAFLSVMGYVFYTRLPGRIPRFPIYASLTIILLFLVVNSVVYALDRRDLSSFIRHIAASHGVAYHRRFGLRVSVRH